MSLPKRIEYRLFPLLSIILLVLLPLTTWITITSTENLFHSGAASAPVTVTVNQSAPIMTSNFNTGASHIQNELFFDGSGASVVNSGKQLLQNSLTDQNVYIMGWGTDNPEPSPNVYNWGSLDSAIALMRATNSTKYISLCCSPDWMKGGTAGQTNWNNIEVAPIASHYADYAALAKQVALRYPDVLYYQVWNEFKGFWNNNTNGWNYQGYTQMYNDVYDALKSVNPKIQVGGPYMAVDTNVTQQERDAITYWLANKHGADFIVLDGGPETTNVASEFDTSDFAAATNWVRTQPNGGATLPIGWAEWYPREPLNSTFMDMNRFNAVFGNDLIATILTGARFGFLWGTEGDATGFTGDYGYPEGIMTSAGTATPAYYTLKAVHDSFSSGTPLYKVTTSSSTITALASASHVLLINTLATAQTAIVNGQNYAMTPYQVLVVSIAPATNTTTATPNPTTNPTVSITKQITATPTIVHTTTPTTATHPTTNPSSVPSLTVQSTNKTGSGTVTPISKTTISTTLPTGNTSSSSGSSATSSTGETSGNTNSTSSISPTIGGTNSALSQVSETPTPITGTTTSKPNTNQSIFARFFGWIGSIFQSIGHFLHL